MSEKPSNLPILTDQEDSPDQREGDGDTSVLTRPEHKTKKPSFFKVILLNDDFTPMDFVVHILKKFFRRSEEESQRIMMQVHKEGSGVAGIYTHEVAETKVYLVNDYARKNQHPLKCTMEKA